VRNTCVDTGSSDLWVITSACTSPPCLNGTASAAYSAQIQSPIPGNDLNINLLYGDSLTGTHAAGTVGKDTGGIAGLSIADQVFGAVTDTNNTSVMNGASGILGLGFPSARYASFRDRYSLTF
jgi:hypothetical protein